MNFTSRTSYDPSNYADVSLPTSTTRTRPRPLSSRDQNAYDKALLHHEQKQYNQEYFKRKNNKAASSSTTRPPTNIRNQQYQFRLSFEDWVKLKSKQTSANARPKTKSSSKKKIATATSSSSSSSTEYNNWLKKDQDKRRKKKRLETSLAKEKRQEQLERKERREELHQQYEEIERKERIQRTKRLRQQKAQRLQLKHEKEIELEAIEKELIQKRKLVYDQWKARKRREQTMINEAKRTATLRRNRDPRYTKTKSIQKNNAGIGGMTDLEEAVDLDQMLEMHRRSLGLPRESVPMMSYGGFRTGLLKVETFPRTQLYRKSLEHLGREEDKVVVEQEHQEEEEEFDVVETVDDFIERSVENLEDTLEGMVLEEE